MRFSEALIQEHAPIRRALNVLEKMAENAGNGVPYSSRAVVTEYFDRFPAPDGAEWFVVTTIVEDPVYLTGRFITSSHFRREPDSSKWAPRPCR